VSEDVEAREHFMSENVTAAEDDDFAQASDDTVAPQSLEAATRLVEPVRFNNLAPEEITPRHLWRARHIVLRARGHLHSIRRDSKRVTERARREAQSGQQLARTEPGRQRARRAQISFLSANELRVHYGALEEERSRFARRISAARDLLNAWEGVHLQPKVRGRRAARALSRAVLAIAREERVTRDSLDETKRVMHQLNIAEDAIRRDGETLRLDPVTFTRFAGRSRKRVRITLAIAIIALVALLYPPWSPPNLTLSCNPAGTGQSGCTQIHAENGLLIFNRGNGVLLGWAKVDVQVDTLHATQSQIIPLLILPHTNRILSCQEVGACTATAQETIHVQIISSGGTSTISVAP